MRALGPPVREIEGRSGLTIDAREGGRYLGIPPQRPIESVTINLVSTKSGAVQCYCDRWDRSRTNHERRCDRGQWPGSQSGARSRRPDS